MTYPPDWPKCWHCDKPALDGRLTCGEAGCSESEARALRDEIQRIGTAARQISDQEAEAAFRRYLIMREVEGF